MELAGNKIIKIKSDGNDALKKLLNDLDRAELIIDDDDDDDDDSIAAAAAVEERNKKWTPEEWYQEMKKRWYFHSTSWYMLEASLPEPLTPEEKAATCNPFTGCIPQCRFYEPEGRIEEEGLKNVIKSLQEFIAWKNRPCTGECKEHHHHHNHQEQEQVSKQ